MDIFSKLHGTTVDRFQIGKKSQRITLTGTNSNDNTVDLVDRDNNKYTANSTVFFTVYLIGADVDSAAYEIKGCYIMGTSTVSGYVTNIFVDTGNFTVPVVTFDNSGVMTISCSGLAGQNITWTAVLDLIKI